MIQKIHDNQTDDDNIRTEPLLVRFSLSTDRVGRFAPQTLLLPLREKRKKKEEGKEDEEDTEEEVLNQMASQLQLQLVQARNALERKRVHDEIVAGNH
jgi:protein tyrosine phosphatase